MKNKTVASNERERDREMVMSDDEDDNVFLLPILTSCFTLTKAVGQNIKSFSFVKSNAIKLSAFSVSIKYPYFPSSFLS